MAICGSRSLRLMAARRRAGLRHPQFLEHLEQRACPAAVSIVGPAEVNETDRTAQFVFTLSEKVAAPVTVNYSLQSTLATATFGRDYRLFVGRSQLRPTGSLTFRAGQTSQTVTMQILDDTLREGNESFTMVLQGARNATVSPQGKALTVTIKDNDNYTVSIVGPATVAAGTIVEYRLRLSSPATKRETFYVSTRDGTAKSGLDYRPLTRVPVTLLPGQSDALVRLVTLGNPALDYDKTVFIDVVPATPGFPAPTPFTTTIPGPLGPRPVDVSVADVTVVEGAAGTTTTANFLITLSGAWTAPVSVNFATADGTATVGDSDYNAASGTVTFAVGETSKLVSVTVVGDSAPEQNETFQLVLSSPINGILARSTATGTITNDDGDPEPEFKIDLVYKTAMKPNWTSVVEQAADRWERVITGDLPDVVFQGRTIDDFEIDVSFESLGPNLLGYARTLNRRPGNSGLPFRGEMVMNSFYADMAGLFDTVVHELAHALGFSPSQWAGMNLNGGTQSNPLFLGVNATREFNAIFGRTDPGVPLYNLGSPGDGSYGAHWRDSLFGYEMMVSAGPVDRSGAALSRITVGHFEDIGYQVDYAAADPFVPNPRQAAPRSSPVQRNPVPGFYRMLATQGNQDAVIMAQAVSFGSGSAPTSVVSIASKTFRALGTLRT